MPSFKKVKSFKNNKDKNSSWKPLCHCKKTLTLIFKMINIYYISVDIIKLYVVMIGSEKKFCRFRFQENKTIIGIIYLLFILVTL